MALASRPSPSSWPRLVKAAARTLEHFDAWRAQVAGLVDSKMEQEKRETQGSLEAKDQGVCRINEDGELEGYCGDGGGIGFSMITEENDNNKDSRYIMHSNYDTIEGNTLSNAVYQGQSVAMETGDQMLSEKRQAFDSDFERLQAERAELMGGQGPQGRR